MKGVLKDHRIYDFIANKRSSANVSTLTDEQITRRQREFPCFVSPAEHCLHVRDANKSILNVGRPQVGERLVIRRLGLGLEHPPELDTCHRAKALERERRAVEGIHRRVPHQSFLDVCF